MGSQRQARNKLPVIELGEENLKPGTNPWRSTSIAVRQALEQCGCFVAVYEKVPSEMHNTIFQQMEELFQLPMEIKVQNTSNLLGFGYGGNFSTMPLVEYFGIENGATLEATQRFTNLMWPNDGNQKFCETALLYSKLVAELHDTVMRMVFDSYGAAEHCEPLIQSAFYLMRFLKYRQPRTSDENVTGLNPHSDKNFLAVIDTNHVKGLQFETKDGDAHDEWVDYEPSPSAFVVIAGEPFMAWSNGRIHCPVHRVVMGGNNNNNNEEEEEEEAKYSIGMFSFMHGQVQVPDELVDEEHPKQFQSFNHMEFLKFCGGDEGMKLKCPIKTFCGLSL